jgi:hypothetical protein
MDVSLVFGYTCPACGCPCLGWMYYTVRVNKGSLRATSGGLGVIPPRCGDCGDEMASLPVESVWVHGADRDKVNAARAKKGWPPLTDWRLVPRESGRLEVIL